MIAAVILAAGASMRLGQPKQDVLLGGTTLLDRTIQTAAAAGLDPLLVVVSRTRSKLLDERVRTLVNETAAEGMASSICLGVAAAAEAECEGIIILACDQPAVTAAHLAMLQGSPHEIVASAYAGRNGVPAYFPSAVFGNLLQLRGDAGARDLLCSSRAIALDGGELDIDTAEDLEMARQLYAGSTR